MQGWVNPNLIANSAGSMGPAGPVLAVMLVAGSGFVGMASPLFSFVGAPPDKRAVDLLVTPPARAWENGAAQLPTLGFALAPASVAVAPASAAVAPASAAMAPSSVAAASSRVAAVPYALRQTALSVGSYHLDSSIDFSAPPNPIATAAIPVVAFSPRVETAASTPVTSAGPAVRQALVQAAPPVARPNEPFALLASAVSLPPVQPTASADMQPSLMDETGQPVAYASAEVSGVQAGAEFQSGDSGSIYKYGARGIEFDVAAKVNGVPVGKVALLIADGENFSVRLADVLTAVEPIMDKAVYAALRASHSSGEYVTLNTLRQSGIAVGFDANDQLILGSR